MSLMHESLLVSNTHVNAAKSQQDESQLHSYFSVKVDVQIVLNIIRTVPICINYRVLYLLDKSGGIGGHLFDSFYLYSVHQLHSTSAVTS